MTRAQVFPVPVQVIKPPVMRTGGRSAPPVRVRQVHQIELSSRCNLRCVYCLHPTMARPKLDMAAETWAQALDWVRFFVRQRTQGELALSVTGESTMHPQFVPWVHEARAVLGWDRGLFVSTNGLLLDAAMARALAPAKPIVHVSLHRPEKAQGAIQALKAYSLLGQVECHAATDPHDWAGQVPWPRTAAPLACPWLSVGWVAVLADGRLATCCYEADAAGILGHVRTPPHADLETRPYGLCATCWHVPPRTLEEQDQARRLFLQLWPPGRSQPEAEVPVCR